MNNKKTLDNVLAAVIILVSAACAVALFFFPQVTIASWGAGFWVMAYALMTWLAKRVHDSEVKTKQEKEDLNRLYQDTMAEKLNYKHEKEDLVQEVLRLEGEVAARDRKIQELSDQIQIEGMKDEVEVKVELSQEQQPSEDNALDDVKATLLKVKKRSSKKK